jgi:hypothetical protein
LPGKPVPVSATLMCNPDVRDRVTWRKGGTGSDSRQVCAVFTQDPDSFMLCVCCCGREWDSPGHDKSCTGHRDPGPMLRFWTAVGVSLTVSSFSFGCHYSARVLLDRPGCKSTLAAWRPFERLPCTSLSCFHLSHVPAHAPHPSLYVANAPTVEA